MGMTAKDRWQASLERCERICKEGLSARSKEVLRRTVRSYYRHYGRILPWRETTDPYNILVSEIMLQQTQVDRVMEKYHAFIQRYPDFSALNRASLRSVFRLWQGLGYNRRARCLKMIARHVENEWQGLVPADQERLSCLPGVGMATAGAIAAFAFNKPVVFIETNIRTVFLHFFFAERDNVRDVEVMPLIAATLDRRHPRTWYWALMDLGVEIKRIYGNPSRKSAHYTKQSRFQGSNRYLRGQIIRLLTRTRKSVPELVQMTGNGTRRLHSVLKELKKERLVEQKGAFYTIATDG
ncbi:MAG: A/G-specific adenine glycosylase [candidate division WOR-3 bacterium]|nr:MAG: A/G-specific adenine glycosylase [candidate division WOR-3 bacterium]